MFGVVAGCLFAVGRFTVPWARVRRDLIAG
jgi:hypothetical protein